MHESGGPYLRLTSIAGGAPQVGVIVKGSQAGLGSLPGGRIRRVTWTNKNGSTAHYAEIFCDVANCGTPVVLPTTASTVVSYSAGVAAKSTFVFDFGPDGIAAPGGIILAASSTADIFTVLSGADAVWAIDYR